MCYLKTKKKKLLKVHMIQGNDKLEKEIQLPKIE